MTVQQQSKTWIYPWLIPLYVCWRVYLANRLPISDCDEVYNYWEPLHFLLYGSGQQTWEYAHQFALRSYAYLVPLQWYVQGIIHPLLRYLSFPSSPFYHFMIPLLTDFPVAHHRLAVFVGLRTTIAIGTALSELYFLYALSDHVSIDVIRWTAAVLCCSAGMNHAAAAYLPSASWMVAWMWSAAFFLRQQHYPFIVVAVSTTLMVGWPFGVVMMVPMGISILWKAFRTRTLFRTLGWITLIAVTIQTITAVIDLRHYGTWVSPNWNIFTYNAGGNGDELYGVEPLSFYVKNLLLNLNVAAPLGLLAFPFALGYRRAVLSDLLVLLSPLYLWLLITLPRPHKEERFLFPIYPLLVFGAVFTVDRLWDSWNTVAERLISGRYRLTHNLRWILHAVLWIPGILLSLGRTAALCRYYSAPLTVYAVLAGQYPSRSGLVCTCGEWYRFPGSFFLPDQAQLAYLPSSFHGQLPQPFSSFGSRIESQSVLQPFNDQNQEELQRYQTDFRHCEWIVDLEGSECTTSSFFLAFEGEQDWHIISQVPFLDAERTLSSLHRTLYIPYWHEAALARGLVHYRNIVLYHLSYTAHDPH